jgi:predicted transcriptional regulator
LIKQINSIKFSLQANRPLNLPTLKKLTEKFDLCQSNILGFVSADDCSIEIRYFALISYSNDNDPFVKFSFGCDLSSLRSPTWDKQYIKTLQKLAKRERKYQLIVHENVFDPFIHCIALFDKHFKVEAIQITIKTNTSTTIQTIPLPIQQIFTKYEIF